MFLRSDVTAASCRGLRSVLAGASRFLGSLGQLKSLANGVVSKQLSLLFNHGDGSNFLQGDLELSSGADDDDGELLWVDVLVRNVETHLSRRV